MKTCPVCQRFFEDSVRACPDDHGSLIAAQASSPATIENYRLGALIESSAAGEIYQATHTTLEQPFVVRIIAAEAIGATEIEREKLSGEARAAAGIVHPNVARTYESGWRADNSFYAVAEAVAGQTLDAHLRRVGALSETEAVTIARQTAEALEAAHRVGVIHRAVNPANVILGVDQEKRRSIKLLNFDFGAVNERIAADEISRSPALARRGYLSPEQFARETVDARTDVFSLGWLLYEMLCARAPFSMLDPSAIADRQIDEQPLVHLRYDVRALLVYLLKQSLQTSAAARLPSAANFARQLRQVEQLVAPSTGLRPTAAQKNPAPKKDESGEAASFGEMPAPQTSESPFENRQPAAIAVDKNVNAAAAAAAAATVTPLPAHPLSATHSVEAVKSQQLGANDFPGWSPIMPEEKSGADLYSATPILVKHKTANVARFEPSTIPVVRKQRDSISAELIPAAAGSSTAAELFPVGKTDADAEATVAKPIVFPVFDVDRRHPEPPAPVRDASDEPRVRARKTFPAKNNRMLVGAALIALVAAVGLGLFLYNQRNQPQNVEQAAVSETPSVNAAAPTPLSADEASAEIAAANAPEPSETEELPLNGVRESSSINSESRQSPATNSESEAPNQPRRETPATNDQAQQPRDSIAERPAPENLTADNESGEDSGTGNAQTELNSSLDRWISATNDRDVERQMNYYAPTVSAYYRARNASPDLVRAEKKRVFERASAVDIQTDKPAITLSRDGQSATMRFRKKYAIKEGQKNRSGEVIQELQWVKSGNDWKIVSERDVKVLKP